MKHSQTAWSGALGRLALALPILLVFLTASPAFAQVVQYRVNTGGPLVQAADGTYPDWAEDQQESNDPKPLNYAKRGTMSPYVNADVAGDLAAGRNKDDIVWFTGIADPGMGYEVLKTARWDPETPSTDLLYSFPAVAGREYKVRMFFNEMFLPDVGDRIFDITIEGNLVEDDLNIYDEAGNADKVVIVREYTVFPDNDAATGPVGSGFAAFTGDIDILFSEESDVPSVTAIEIIDMESTNNAPSITDPGDQADPDGAVISLQIVGSDGDGDDVEFSAMDLPPGLSISSTGLITGTIDDEDLGTYDSRVFIVDDGDPSMGNYVNFTWTVLPDAPFVDSPIADINEFVGEAAAVIDLDNVFEDPNLLALTYTVEGNTDGAVVTPSIDGSDLTLTYSTTTAGTSTVTIRATNSGAAFVEDVFDVTLTVPPSPTVDNPIADISDSEGAQSLIDLDGVFSDPNALPLTYSVQNNTSPSIASAVITSTTLTVDLLDEGSTTVTVRATNSGGAFIDDVFDVDVVSGTPFVANPIDDVEVDENSDPVVIDISDVFEDPGDLELTLTVHNNTNPSLVTPSLDGTDLTLTFTPDEFGEATVKIRATNTNSLTTDDVFDVTVNEDSGGIPNALIEITAGKGLGASTFNPDSFKITNNSTGSVEIEKVTIDLSSSIFPDMVFDPNGNGGDSTGKCLTIDSGEAETGYTVPASACADPFTNAQDGGFLTAELNFTDFQAGEMMTFSVDVDPTSIKGTDDVGDAGSVAGVELSGAAITVEFSDGSVITNDIFNEADLLGGGGNTIVKDGVPGAPSIAVKNVTTPGTVTIANQTIEVTGTPGAEVRLLQLDGRMFTGNGAGFDIDPFEANQALTVIEYAGTIGGGGTVDIPVTLKMTSLEDGSGGLNYFMAVVENNPTTHFTGRASNVEVVQLQTSSNFNMDTGWNLIALSYDVDDNSYASLFGVASPPFAPYFWNGTAYEQQSNLNAGFGYWQKVDDGQTVSILGTDIGSMTLDLDEGWNMIGGPSCNFPFGDIIDLGGVLIPGTLFGYDGGYVAETTINANQGYWVRTNAAGSILMNCAILGKGEATADAKLAHEAFGALQIADAQAHSQKLYFGAELEEEVLVQYSMPPMPQQGSFDARFAGDSRLVVGDEGFISLTASEFPVEIKLDDMPDASFETYVIAEMIGNEVIRTHSLHEGETVVITDEAVTVLQLTTESALQSELPEQFEVHGNFPNPFNPSTTVVFDLPEDASVRVQIFDMLGRRVMSLDAMDFEAGAGRQLAIDASRLASGMYVYRVMAEMESSQMVRTGRMTLLK